MCRAKVHAECSHKASRADFRMVALWTSSKAVRRVFSPFVFGASGSSPPSGVGTMSLRSRTLLQLRCDPDTATNIGCPVFWQIIHRYRVGVFCENAPLQSLISIIRQSCTFKPGSIITKALYITIYIYISLSIYIYIHTYYIYIYFFFFDWFGSFPDSGVTVLWVLINVDPAVAIRVIHTVLKNFRKRP